MIKRFKKSLLPFVKQNKGFTLIEFLIYIGLFSILLTITLQMYASIFEVQVESQATSSVASDGKFIMGRFSYDLNRASSIVTPDYLGTPSASFEVMADAANLRYSLSNGNLILENTTLGTTDQLNTGDTSVSNLSFVRLDGGDKDTVQVTFTLTSSSVMKGGAEVKTFQTSAGLR
jgi:prepilin-type N-terminal cleavage/methylation domain-containing protein